MSDQSVSIWQKLNAVSTLIAALVIPIVLTVVANMYSSALKEREIQGRYVELALTILKEPASQNNMNLRTWAAQIINRYAPFPLSADGQTELQTRTISGPDSIVLFDNGNIDGVTEQVPGPPKLTQFNLAQPYQITNVRTYHWNGGKGSTPGTISLKNTNGTVYGPWEVAASSGQGGASNVNWEVHPNTLIPAGTYTVVDSDAATWSYNDRSGQAGFAFIKGLPTSS